MTPIYRLTAALSKPSRHPCAAVTAALFSTKRTTNNNKAGDDKWNDAWETAWLPDDHFGKSSPVAPWESDVTFSLPTATAENTHQGEEIDFETKAFVEDMNENWDQRKGKTMKEDKKNVDSSALSSSSSLYSLENIKRDYRLKKQKIHAGLWMKEIEKMEEAKLGDSISVDGDNIEKLLDSCSEIFDSGNNDFNNSKSSTDFKNKPDGWETTSKTPDGNIWEMSQREEDILLQEFERRIAFNKFQIASFIKTHIFSRRRPIDGWKYMIEEIGPNAKRSKGSVSRLPSVSDESTQPFREEKTPVTSTFHSQRGR